MKEGVPRPRGCLGLWMVGQEEFYFVSNVHIHRPKQPDRFTSFHGGEGTRPNKAKTPHVGVFNIPVPVKQSNKKPTNEQLPRRRRYLDSLTIPDSSVPGNYRKKALSRIISSRLLSPSSREKLPSFINGMCLLQSYLRFIC